MEVVEKCLWLLYIPAKLARFHLLCLAEAWEHFFGRHSAGLSPSPPLEAVNLLSNSRFYTLWQFRKYWPHLHETHGIFHPKLSNLEVFCERHATKKRKNELLIINECCMNVFVIGKHNWCSNGESCLALQLPTKLCMYVLHILFGWIILIEVLPISVRDTHGRAGPNDQKDTSNEWSTKSDFGFYQILQPNETILAT